MDICEIEERLQKIRDSKGDDQVAHESEFYLYRDFVRSLTEEPGVVGEKAKLVASASDLTDWVEYFG